MSEKENQTITLKDGRTIGFAEYGDPQGRPLIAIHGTPGARIIFRGADEAARGRQIRMIAPDRPGYGLSSAHDERTLKTFAADIGELADQLGFDQFMTVGVSGGGPHAVALGTELCDRVSSIGLVCPLGPIAEEAYKDTVGSGYTIFFRHLISIPGAMKGCFSVGRFGFCYAPAVIYAAVLARATRDDWPILMRRSVRKWITDAMAEGLRRDVSGGLKDLDVFAKPWDLQFENISAPIHLWQGLSDRNVPPQAALRLGANLPNCRVHEIPRAGHYWIFDNIGLVLDYVAEAARLKASDVSSLQSQS